MAIDGDYDGPMILGTQLINPYSVTNMRKAWDTLVRYESDFLQGIQLSIQATHVYVKFDPQNEEELSALKRDTTISYYTYPLDYAIERMGHYYHDPAKPSEMPTYHYASVPVDKELPAVGHEILEQLFIPDEYKDGMTDPLGDQEEVIEALVETSLALTGNLEAENGRVQGNTGGRVSRRSKWRPAGVIRVLDNSSTPNFNRPMRGVKVKVRRWFTTHKGVTDDNGHYSVDGQFRRDAEYNIDWERHEFAIRKGWLAGARFNGPKMRGDWSPTWNHGEQMHYARAFMAAERYYYGYIFGLRKPPLNTFWTPQMKIRVHDDHGPHFNLCNMAKLSFVSSPQSRPANHCEERRFFGLGNQINIYRTQGNSGTINFMNMYATVIHELAHASHWKMSSGNNFDNSEKMVKESWAEGVEVLFVRTLFPSYNGARGNINIGRDPYDYTDVVIDLMDGAETNLINGDMVSGYTIREIEDALQNSTTWHAWRDAIINLHTNNTETHVDELFDYWN